jgi:TetR/AcrR family transcriptional regulator, cholesterol catabolism regulator
MVLVARAISDPEVPEARLRILDAAESLYAKRGFDSVTLREIAAPLGLSHAALYYHFPGGKEELFAEVMERNIRRHGEGLSVAMASGGASLRSELRGAADWLLSQEPMDLIRMNEIDLPALEPKVSRKLMELVYELVIGRIQAAIEEARVSGRVGDCNAGLLAGGLFGLVENLFAVPASVLRRDRRAMAYEFIDVILKGIDYAE